MDIFWNYALIFLLSSEVVTLATPVMVTISPGTQLSTKRNKTKLSTTKKSAGYPQPHISIKPDSKFKFLKAKNMV